MVWLKHSVLIGLSFVMVVLSAAMAHASATLLLEEPYGELGPITATGHAAVYLSGVCADTPILLRPCAPGRTWCRDQSL